MTGREIKFRFWNTDKKEWVKLPAIVKFDAGNEKIVLKIVEGNPNEVPKNSIWSEFTGFLDSEGVEVYEGDILQKFERVCVKSCDSKAHIKTPEIIETDQIQTLPDGTVLHTPYFSKTKVEQYDPNDPCTCVYEEKPVYFPVEHSIGFEGDGDPASGFFISDYYEFGGKEGILGKAEIVGNVYESPELLDK